MAVDGGVTARAFRPVRVGKMGMTVALQIPVAVAAALMPTLAPGDRVTLISAGDRAPGTRDKTYQVTFRQQELLYPGGGLRTIKSRFGDGWTDFAADLALTPEDAIQFEVVGEGGGVPDDGSQLPLRALGRSPPAGPPAALAAHGARHSPPERVGQ